MKKIITSLVVAALGVPSILVHAEVPSLADSIQALDTASFSEFQESITESDTVITADVDFALDTAVVNEAVEQGLITGAEAADLESALETIEANSEFFDFDIADFLAAALASGDVTAAEANEVLTAFSQLSPEGKAIVGAESFSPFDLTYLQANRSALNTLCSGACTGSDLINGVSGHSADNLQSDAFESLSDADKAIVGGVSLTTVTIPSS